MQEIRSSNPPVVTGIFDPYKSPARHHRSFKLGWKLKYLNIIGCYMKETLVVNGCMWHYFLQVVSPNNTYCWTVKMRLWTRVTSTTRRLLEKVTYISAQRCTMKQTTKWNNYYDHCHWLIRREGNLGGSLKHIYFLTMVLGVT